GQHCCEAMVEIQKLRQELDWVTNKYRTLAETNEHCPTDGGGESSSSSSNQFSGTSRMITSP
ncbi:hypothetical protein BGX23_007953, partial [Mortierella sp. AD031]